MLHQIGVGALGPVFRTYEPTRDRLVAVKVFRLDVIPEQARALADELARAADAGLFHPSIVEPVAAGIEGTVAYRAEEYVAAESLDVAMRHYAPAAVDKVLPFITQLASALDFARAAGVGHGALHPRDIFVTPDEARATGFGVVDALERLGLRAPVRRPYSPPERIAGEAWGTPADVFSLGVIAFELFTGRRPSGLGEDMGPLTGATLGDRADGVRAVLGRAMHASPAARYATASAFSAALADAAGVAETPTVALPYRIVGRQIAQVDASELHVAHPEPVVAPADLPVAVPAPATDPATDVVIEAADQVLEDFASEAEVPSATDSPREVARKVIAAREVRKRQVRKKTADGESTDAAAAAPVEDAASASVGAALPVAGVLFDTATVDAPAAALVSPVVNEVVPTLAEVAPAAVHEVVQEVVPKDDAVVEGAALEAAVSATDAPMKPPAPLQDSIKDPKDTLLEDVAIHEPSTYTPLLELTVPVERPVLEAVEFVPTLREVPDRVVAVDEFRAREATTAKSDRSWPRVAEPKVPDRPERVPAAPTASTVRTSGPAAIPVPGSGLGLGLSSASSRGSLDDPILADGTPPAFEDLAPERQRVVMLPVALGVCLGLLLGYALGYVVGNREKAPTVAGSTASPTPSERQTATTGTPVGDETTVTVPPPTKTPGTATGGTPAASSPSSTVAPSRPPAPAPSTTRAVKPVLTAGRIVVTSNPAKAAVTINGKWSGRTPLTLDNLKFGKYEVRVVQPGFEVARERFALSKSDASRAVDVNLRRVPAAKGAPAAEAPTAQSPATPTPPKPTVPATGTIFVDSRPQGARVFIDGKDVGVTPLSLAGQPAGPHEVRLELADHVTVTAKTQVISQKPAHVTLSLERVR